MVISEATHGHSHANLNAWNRQSFPFNMTFDGIGNERVRFGPENGYEIILDVSVSCS